MIQLFIERFDSYVSNLFVFNYIFLVQLIDAKNSTQRHY